MNDYKAPTPRQVLKTCLNIKHLVDTLIPQCLPVEEVTQNSKLINNNTIRLTLEACGGGSPESKRRYQTVVVFCLLKLSSWYEELATSELHDSELHQLRSTTSQIIASKIIDYFNKDDFYLFKYLLCEKFVINTRNQDNEPVNAIELAIDLHSTIVISSKGFQRCIKWIWKGWIIPSNLDPNEFIFYQDVSNSSVMVHFNPNRLKSPVYQNKIEIIFSLLYLINFTIIVNK